MEENGNNSGWWGTIVSAARNKSVEVLEFMKRDFDEFSSAVKSEASTLAEQTASAVKETLQLDKETWTATTMKRSVSSFLGSVKSALSPSPSCDLDEALVIHDGNPVTMTSLQRQLHALVVDRRTFLDEISTVERGRFVAWLGVVEDTLSSVERLTHLLSVDPVLQEMYTDLVPVHVSHTLFWERYLFRKAVLEDAEAAEAAEAARARRRTDELSEEEQMRIIAAYDEEKRAERGAIAVKEKKDMVIVGPGNDTSSSSKASTDGDWEKEFDLEEEDKELK